MADPVRRVAAAGRWQGRWVMAVRAWLVLLAVSAVSRAQRLEVISSAELCGGCHRAIHEAWKRSAHAAAMESRLFQDALALAERDFGGRARPLCLPCHSPLGVHLQDFSLKQKVSREGVTCDWCHSVRRVRFRGPNAAPVAEFSLVKTGPSKGSRAVAHGTEYAEVHTNSSICAPCHQYRTVGGLDLLATYEEWRVSRYGSERRHCQSCHMSQVAGDVVDPKVQASPKARINLHEMPGSRSVNQLNQALRMVLAAGRKGDSVEVEIELGNVGAGHAMPTGSPMRELILEVTADAREGQDFTESRRYRRVVADPEGKPIELEHEAFFRAAKVVSDNRLAAEERRKERFRFPVPDGVPVEITARLSYYYSPLAQPDSEKRVVFRTISRLVH